VLTLLYLQPLRASASAWAWPKLLVVLLAAQVLKVHSARGLPPSWRWADVRAWAAGALATSDAQYALLAAMAASQRPMVGLLPPFVVMAGYHVGGALEAHLGRTPWWQRHGAQAYRTMLAKRQAVAGFVAQSEILLGLTLTLGLLLPGRAPLFTLWVWQFLRLRFWAPDSAAYHRQVRGWERIARACEVCLCARALRFCECALVAACQASPPPCRCPCCRRCHRRYGACWMT
jgi:hypothetical protein